MILISPTEPLAIKMLGTVSSLPERYGADILLLGKWGLCGVQRKEVKDYVNSVRGDRVAREIGQMKALQHGVWIIEGKWHWTLDGASLTVPTYSLTEFRGSVFSLNLNGFWTLHSENMADTCDLVLHLTRWLEKGEHGSLQTRPKPQAQWGRITNRDWGCHLLMSFESVSWKKAAAIWDHFGGVPMAWTVTVDELMEVPGIGRKTAERLIEGLRCEQPATTD